MMLLDSDVLIAHLRGIPAARDWLIQARRDAGRLRISAVSVAEVTGGMRAPEKVEVTRLLASMEVVPVNARAGWLAGEFMRRYRRSHASVGLGDYLIAATADVEGLDLQTLNVRHFPMWPELRPPFELPRH